MQTFLFSLLVFLSTCSHCFADWSTAWAEARICCQEGNFEKSEFLYNFAINELELSDNNDHPEIYIDRASLYLLLDRNEEVLPDIERALHSPKLSPEERMRAIVTRLMAYAKLGMDAEALADLVEFTELYKNAQPQEDQIQEEE